MSWTLSETVDLHDVYVTILAGGSGTRLWPYSRRKQPKQLLNLAGDLSLLQQTVNRVRPLVPPERIHILTGPEHAEPIAAQLPDLPRGNIQIEPAPAGTAPCLGLAAMRLRRLSAADDAVMISLHADHVVREEERFRQTLITAVAAARRDYLVTIGIVPSYPETGFGYIERADLLAKREEQPVYRVARFTEKPHLELARDFVASGRFYWNTGYFTWTLDRILGEFLRLQPLMFAQLKDVADAFETPEGIQAASCLWAQIQPTTIDVGIMERARDVAVLPCDLGWNDVGSWAALFDILGRDEANNVIMGRAQHVGLDTADSLVYSEGKLVATIGLRDIIIVNTGDALLVLPKERAQEVSALVKELRARGLDRYL
jgi:mannose-1-phosphate guanylyltransferase